MVTTFDKPVGTEIATLKSNITTLNSSLETVKTRENFVMSLVLPDNATSSATEFSTYNGRKFSDYRLIVFNLYDSKTSTNTIRESVIIPASMWTTGRNIYLVQNHGTNLGNVSGIVIMYNSDTSVKAVTTGANLLTGFEIIGYSKL